MPRREPNEFEAEKFGPYPYYHGALTTDTPAKLFKVPAGRTLRLTAVSYINPTGLAADNTNAFSLTVKNGSTVVATVFNTDGDDDPVGASVPVDTFVDGVLSDTDSEHVFAAGDIVSLLFDEDGTATLPAGTVILTGYMY